MLAWDHSAWTTIEGANGISTAYDAETPAAETWRKFVVDFDLPCNAVNISGTVQVAVDNNLWVYLNGEVGTQN